MTFLDKWAKDGSYEMDPYTAKADLLAFCISLFVTFISVLIIEPSLGVTLFLGLVLYIGIRLITTVF
jgi:hypothetical protein